MTDHQTDREAAVEPGYEGDMTIIAKYLTPTEAHLLCACLHAAGIPADAGDTHTVQMHSLLTVAVGGARVRVPAAHEAEAHAVIAAFHRGEFTLADDFNPEPDEG